jgi:hypothetical protein
MEPKILTTLAEGMDTAEEKGWIDSVQIAYEGKIFAMGFITIQRINEEFSHYQKINYPYNLSGHDKYHIVSAVTPDIILKTFLQVEKSKGLKYYLISQS